jgi:hypothetical protein
MGRAYKTNKKFLSASKVKTLDTCSWTYWCKYHLGLPDGTNSGALRGTLCHTIFELLLKKKHRKHYEAMLEVNDIKGSKTIHRYVLAYLRKHKIEKYGKESFEENYDLVNNMILVGLKIDFFGEGGVIDKPEQDFEIKSKKPKYNIKGFIDKPVQYKDKNTVEVVDYKSSKAKFRGEELTSNIQAMMYTLAAKKLWPKLKRIIVKFLFLRFPRQPVQELEFSDEQIKGFEHYLEHVNTVVENFSEEDACANFAADNSSHWLCGPAKSGWICPFHKPFDYYVLLDEKGSQVSSSHKDDLNPSGGQTVEKREYEGCPRKMSESSVSAAQDFLDSF